MISPEPELVQTVPRAKAPGKALVRLLRPRQWVKNAFVVAPAVFAAVLTRPGVPLLVLAATLLFCVASSAVYVVNDLADAQADRQHPTKRHSRPIAAGDITPRQALVVLGCLYAVLLAAWLLPPLAAAGLWGYVALNLAYTFKLKRVAVVDLFCVALGFVIRIWVGAMAIAVPLTSWMAVTTLCLALYLATIKRQQELKAVGAQGRDVLGLYSVELLERYAQFAAMGALVFYSLFTMTVRPQLAATIPLVMFGLFRYWYLVDRHGAGESPTDVVWADLPLALTVAAWGLASWLLLIMR